MNMQTNKQLFQQIGDLLQLPTVPGAADVLCMILVLVLLLPIEPLVAAIVCWWGSNEHRCATKSRLCGRTHSMERRLDSIHCFSSFLSHMLLSFSIITCLHTYTTQYVHHVICILQAAPKKYIKLPVRTINDSSPEVPSGLPGCKTGQPGSGMDARVSRPGSTGSTFGTQKNSGEDHGTPPKSVGESSFC